METHGLFSLTVGFRENRLKLEGEGEGEREGGRERERERGLCILYQSSRGWHCPLVVQAKYLYLSACIYLFPLLLFVANDIRIFTLIPQ